MAAENSLVTIAITCYNAADSIIRALDSAFAQDWPHLEILVCDDCSMDGSAGLVRQVIAGHDNARLLQHVENLGPAAARNTLLAAARGEFVAFLDDDDVSLPTRVRRQVETLRDWELCHPNSLAACYAGGERHYDSGYIKPLPAIGSQGQSPKGPGVADYLLFYRKRADWFYGAGVPTCALLARRSTFEQLGGFDTRLRRVEDADFAIRLALAGGVFIGTHETLFIQYATQAQDKSPELNLAAEQFLADKHGDYLRSVGRYEYARRWPRLRYLHFRHDYVGFVAELLWLLARNPVAVLGHVLQTGPQRLLHEWRIRHGG